MASYLSSIGSARVKKAREVAARGRYAGMFEQVDQAAQRSVVEAFRSWRRGFEAEEAGAAERCYTPFASRREIVLEERVAGAAEIIGFEGCRGAQTVVADRNTAVGIPSSGVSQVCGTPDGKTSEKIPCGIARRLEAKPFWVSRLLREGAPPVGGQCSALLCGSMLPWMIDTFPVRCGTTPPEDPSNSLVYGPGLVVVNPGAVADRELSGVVFHPRY